MQIGHLQVALCPFDFLPPPTVAGSNACILEPPFFAIFLQIGHLQVALCPFDFLPPPNVAGSNFCVFIIYYHNISFLHYDN